MSDADAWGNALAERLGWRIGNFGVGGYGTDQALLRFERNATDRAPVTILGFFVRDVLRNVTQYLQLDFTSYPTSFKPRFVLDDGGLQVVPLPRIPPDDLTLFGEHPERFLAHETFLPGSRYGGTRIAFPYSLVLVRLLVHERARARIAGRPNWADFLTPGHPSGGARGHRRDADKNCSYRLSSSRRTGSAKSHGRAARSGESRGTRVR